LGQGLGFGAGVSSPLPIGCTSNWVQFTVSAMGRARGRGRGRGRGRSQARRTSGWM
jgi:hypothetical protein